MLYNIEFGKHNLIQSENLKVFLTNITLSGNFEPQCVKNTKDFLWLNLVNFMLFKRDIDLRFVGRSTCLYFIYVNSLLFLSWFYFHHFFVEDLYNSYKIYVNYQYFSCFSFKNEIKQIFIRKIYVQYFIIF